MFSWGPKLHFDPKCSIWSPKSVKLPLILSKLVSSDPHLENSWKSLCTASRVWEWRSVIVPFLAKLSQWSTLVPLFIHVWYDTAGYGIGDLPHLKLISARVVEVVELVVLLRMHYHSHHVTLYGIYWHWTMGKEYCWPFHTECQEKEVAGTSS